MAYLGNQPADRVLDSNDLAVDAVTTAAAVFCSLPVSMRTNPAVTLDPGAGVTSWEPAWWQASLSFSGLSIAESHAAHSSLDVQLSYTPGGLTVGNTCMAYAGTFSLSAEI